MTLTLNGTVETLPAQWQRVATIAEIQEKGNLTVHAGGNVIALFKFDREIYAVDNRCPHMGFPLDKGSVHDGILTCHWHHARFDLKSGGTFDLWADDVRNFPVHIVAGDVYVDLTPPANGMERQQKRLRDGLERNIRLVIAKSVLGMGRGETTAEGVRLPFSIGLDYGARNRRDGWNNGQTIHALLMNLLSHLDDEDKPKALYNGLTAVARDCDGQPARFAVEPLPNSETDLATLKKWFVQFVEVRDTEGAERCLVSAVKAGHSPAALADMLTAATTEHRYLDIGHTIDYINKAFEALEWAGWEYAAPVLASLVPALTSGERQEETNAWRTPVNLVAILENAFAALPGAIAEGRDKTWDIAAQWDTLVENLLGDDPAATSDKMLAALRSGATFEDLAQLTAYAAARRIVHFPISNEFGDWNTVHHTYTYTNAVHQAMRRSPSPELLRGVWDAAMSIYLDRFLNVPATKIPSPKAENVQPDNLLPELLELFNSQQRVNQAGELVARYLGANGDPARLIATLGKALLREDAGFHAQQSLEASVRQYYSLASRPATQQYAPHALIAAARYLAAHFPTPRAGNQTFQIALRLHRDEKVFEE
jgi:nitrite reductase/ring-hydroxylating ferredoxin subunit